MTEYKEALFPEFEGDERKRIFKRRKNRNSPFVRKKYYKFSEEKVSLFLLIFLFALASTYIGGYRRGKLYRQQSESNVTFSNIVVKSGSEETAGSEKIVLEESHQKTEEPGAEYTIQVVTYKNLSYADAEKEKLENLGYSAYLSDEGRYKIVYAGQYRSRNEAEKFLSQLKKIYPDAFVKKIKGGN